MYHKSNKSRTPVPFSGEGNLLDQFQKYIKTENLFEKNDRLLLAVSGGLDSVVLCHLCKAIGIDFSIAHCNFQLRGEESDGDEAFVKALAEKYKVDVLVKRFETGTYAQEKKISTQVAARELRYEWFAQVLKATANKPFRYLLTAHHANDNIETLLMNFFKGTGIAGLQGILPKSGVDMIVVRPLLFAKKEQLLNFAKEKELDYREDSSNSSNKYTRNYFRNELIPSIRKVYPQVEDNLLDNIDRFAGINILYRQWVEILRKKLIVEKQGEYHLPVLRLLKTAALPTVLFELTKVYDFTPGQTADIIKLLNSESGKYVDSSSHRILRNRKWLIISRFGEENNVHFIIDDTCDSIRFPGNTLSIEKMPAPGRIDSNPLVVQLDASHIRFPLLLRKWKQGDYFYPLGMKKKKKLSRFFIDNKLSINEKLQTWVIETDKKIVWVVGQRIDDRFKVGSETKDTIRLSLLPSQ